MWVEFFCEGDVRTMLTTTTMATIEQTGAVMTTACDGDGRDNNDNKDEHCDDAGTKYNNNDGDSKKSRKMGDHDEDDDISVDKDESTINKNYETITG